MCIRDRLRGVHDHTHSGDDKAPHPQDHNLRAAYFHVLADALTSFLAIFALSTGKVFGWVWMDPAMGLVGAVVIVRWSYNLLKDTATILLDRAAAPELIEAIRSAVESPGRCRITDLHVWRLNAVQFAAVISLVTRDPNPPDHYKRLLSGIEHLVHVSIEVNPTDTAGNRKALDRVD